MVAPRTRAAVAFAVGTLALVGMVWYVGLSEIVAALRRASPMHFAFAFLAYALFFVFRGLRWKMLLSQSAPDLRATTTTHLTAVGWLANSILPLKGGDVLRAALLAKRGRLALVTSAASVALERVLDMLGLAALAAIGLLLVPHATELPGWLVPALRVAAILPVVAIVALIALVRYREPSVELGRRLMRPFGRLGAKLVNLVDTTLAGLGALARHPRLVLLLAPLTMVIVVLQAMVFAFLVQAFIPGVPFALGFAGASLFLLSFVVSFTPGNVGTYEAAFIAIFGALGVVPEVVVPAAILTHVSTTLVVVVLGGAGMLALGAEPGVPVTLRAARPTQGGSP